MRPPAGFVRPLGACAGAALAWGLLESQWVERRVVPVSVRGLPAALDGLRILHLSDFHLGSPSLNGVALRRAISWAADRDVDLAVITGDLLSRDRGESVLRSALARLRPRLGTYAVLGNHDVAVARDPFSRVREIGDLRAAGVTLLRDESVSLDACGARIQLAGVDPRSYLTRTAQPELLADPGADARVLLCHFPRVVDRMPRGTYELVLAGHVHGGQICVPYPGGKITFGELRPRYRDGVFRLGGTTLVVSRGTGTAFVPFRFCARPEVAELVLRPAERAV